MRPHSPRPLLGSALSSRVAQWTQRSILKSVQAGTVTLTSATSATATITAVDVNNSVLVFDGYTYANADTDTNAIMCQIALTNSTTVTASRGAAPNGATVLVPFTVIEYVPGIIKSVQRGTANVGATTITTVNVAKAFVSWLGWSTDSTAWDGRWLPKLVLTDATTVTISRGGSPGDTPSIGYQVTEYF